MAISCGKFCVKPLDLGGNNSKSTLPFRSILFGWNLNVFSQTHRFLGCFRTAKPHFGAGNHHFRWLTSVFRCLDHTVSEFFRRWWPPLAMIIHEPWIRFNGLREKSKPETIEIFRHMEVSSLYFPPKKNTPLKILKHAQSIDFEKFKPVMLAALRSLLPGCPGWRPRPARAWSLDFPGWDLLRISWGIYWWFNGSYWDIPSGKLSHNYGKSPFYSCTQWPFSSSHSVNVYRRERSKIDMNKPSTIVSPLSNIISNWMVYDVAWP